jgi:hypothetical protein
MAFSTSICLTSTGNLPSGCTLNFYSNVDNYTQNFNISPVPLSSITGTNCPYTLTNVPQGTTKIKIKGPCSDCCVVLDIIPNDPCTFCNLGFDVFSASTIGQIVAGNITGSCDANITDYLIEWYDITNPNLPVLKFTSGHGLIFTYQYTHPLVNTSAINPALPGLYKPFLRKIIINGITYSYNGGTGTVQANLDCFSTVTVNVLPLNCGNGTEEGDYSHKLEFSGTTNGLTPSPMSTVFQLSADTNYMAWKFWGYDIADEFKITYYGSHYNNKPIILEWFKIGNGLAGSNTFSNIFPKEIKTYPGSPNDQYYKKVTCLTGIIRSDNDYLIINITPNTQNNKTNFKLLINCLSEFNCETCFDSELDSTTGYKIIESSIILDPRNCGHENILFYFTGCGINDLYNSDLYKYVKMPEYSSRPSSMTNYISQDGLMYFLGEFYWVNNSCAGGSSIGYPSPCATPKNEIISFTKDNSGPGGQGKISITFSSIIDFDAYYNSYNSQISNIAPIITDPTQLDYYSRIFLHTPIPIGPNDQCGDPPSNMQYIIHATSVVTTGFTNNMYTLEFTMPTITKQIFFPNGCSGCNGTVDWVVGMINNSSISTTNNLNYTNYRGIRYTQPFNSSYKISLFNSAQTSGGVYDILQYSKFTNDTKPFSANTDGTYSYIPSLSASTCGFSNLNYYPESWSYGDLIPNDSFYYQILAFYLVELTNPLNPADFVIKSSPINHGTFTTQSQNNPYTGPYPDSFITIYQYVNGVGTVLQPSYFI